MFHLVGYTYRNTPGFYLRVFWDVMLCHSVGGSPISSSLSLKMKVLYSLKTLGTTCLMSQCNKPEGLNPQIQCYENLKSHRVRNEF